MRTLWTFKMASCFKAHKGWMQIDCVCRVNQEGLELSHRSLEIFSIEFSKNQNLLEWPVSNAKMFKI